MPGNLPVPNGLEVLIGWGPVTSGIIRAISVLHFQQSAATTTDQARANAIDTLIKGVFTSSGLVASIAPIYGLLRCSVRDMAANTNPVFLASGASVPGTAVGDALPPQISLVVTNQTALRGRSFKGRTYLWGYAEATSDSGGGAAGTTQTQSAAFLNAIRTGMAGAPQNAVFSVLSRFTTPPGSPPNTPPTERPIPLLTPVTTSLLLNGVWDTQRRRID